MIVNFLKGNQSKRKFDPQEIKHLGTYVYILRDPRDGKIFYVGQGVENRIFKHFDDADKWQLTSGLASSKILRILDIWANDEDVDWAIIAHKLSPERADAVESAVIDALSLSQNGPALNQIRGPGSSMLVPSDLANIAAAAVNPTQTYKTVFVFPVTNALAEGKNEYEATRRAWYVKESLRLANPAHAVGISNGVSVAAFSIERWVKSGEKFAFEGEPGPAELAGKNWQKVINQALGYWQRGNYLVVTFPKPGYCQIIRGAGRESSSFTLE